MIKDGVFLLSWNYSLEKLNMFFGFMSSIDTTGKIKFRISVVNESVLDFFYLSMLIMY